MSTCCRRETGRTIASAARRMRSWLTCWAKRFSSVLCTPGLILQFVEQRLGLLEVGRVKALGEPTVDRREELVSLSALALLPPQTSKAHGSAQAVLRLGSDPRGDIVDLDDDAFPLPVGVSNAGEAIFDQRPAGRTLGCKIDCERGAHRPCSGRR